MTNWPLSSDGLLWGTSTPPKIHRQSGRKPVLGEISIITRVGKTRPGIYLRLRWPWFVEAGWKFGDKLTVEFMNDWISDTEFMHFGFIERPKPGNRGYILQKMSDSRDARVLLPLDMNVPYIPKAQPLQDLEFFGEGDGGPYWYFLISETDKKPITVGDFLRQIPIDTAESAG